MALHLPAVADARTQQVLGIIARTFPLGQQHLSNESVGTAQIENGSITTPKIKAGAIEAGSLAAESVTTEKLHAEAVTAAKITAGTITATQLAANSITAVKIEAGSVTAAKVAAEAIEAGSIKAGAVIAAKISAEAVEAGKIKAEAVETGKLKAEAVTAAKIQAGAVGTVQLAAEAVTAATIASAAVTASKISVSELSALTANAGTITAGTITGATVRSGVSGKRVVLDSEGIRAYNAAEALVLNFSTSTGNLSIKGKIEEGSEVPASTVTGQLTNAQIKEIEAAKLTGTITETQIGKESITTPKIKAGAVEAAQLAASAVTAEKIAAGEVTTTALHAEAVTAAKIASEAVEAKHIKADSITASQIAADSIGTSELAANAVAAENIVAGTITAGKIASGTITATQLSATAIDAMTITGATIRTSSSAPKVQLDTSGLQIPVTTSAEPEDIHQIEFKNNSGTTAHVIYGYDSGALNAANLLLLANKGPLRKSGEIVMEAEALGTQNDARLELSASESGAATNVIEAQVGDGVSKNIVATVIRGDGASSFLQLVATTKRKLVVGLITLAAEKATITVGTGFTVERTAKGKFTIKLTTELTETGVMHVSSAGGSGFPTAWGKKEFKVETFNAAQTALEDRTFHFYIVG